MFTGAFVVITMLATSAVAALLCAVRAFLASTPPARADAAAQILVAGVLAGTAMGLGRAAPWTLATMLAAALTWFLARAARGRRRRERGAAVALFRSATAVLAGWALYEAVRSGTSATAHPAHQLGGILADLLGAAVMAIAAAGWLLGAFATPRQEGGQPVAPLTGTTEAMLSICLAVALYAIS